MFSLSFHHLLTIFCFLYKFVFLQVYVLPCVFTTFCFAKCYFICLLSNSFWQVLSLFYTMVVGLMKEARLVVTVDDLDFRIKDVAFKANVFNRYGTFD